MTKSRRPECQPFVDAFDAFFAENPKTTKMGLCEQLYGRDDRGRVKCTGMIYPTICGLHAPGNRMIERIRDVIGLDLTEARSEFERLRQNGRKTRTSRPGLTPVHAVVTAFEQAAEAKPSGTAVKSASPRFSLIISKDGLADVSLSLTGIPTELAMQVYWLLADAGSL